MGQAEIQKGRERNYNCLVLQCTFQQENTLATISLGMRKKNFCPILTASSIISKHSLHQILQQKGGKPGPIHLSYISFRKTKVPET